MLVLLLLMMLLMLVLSSAAGMQIWNARAHKIVMEMMKSCCDIGMSVSAEMVTEHEVL